MAKKKVMKRVRRVKRVIALTPVIAEKKEIKRVRLPSVGPEVTDVISEKRTILRGTPRVLVETGAKIVKRTRVA